MGSFLGPGYLKMLTKYKIALQLGINYFNTFLMEADVPVYEYICKDCGQQFDKMRPMSQADVVIECTNCHSESTRRKLSLFFASSEGRAIATQSSSCSGCGGGSCGSCGCGSN